MAEEQRCVQYHMQRDVLDEQSLDNVAQKMPPSKFNLKDYLKKSLRCSVQGLKRSVMARLPVLSWLPSYPIRAYGPGDLVSGCSVGIMHLPQGMAYALLASVPPVHGLYSSFYPLMVYFLLGTSRHISIGTFSVISVMVGSVTERLAPDKAFLINGTNATNAVDIAARDAYRVEVAAAVALLGGIIQVLLGLIQFGFVATYLSQPLVRGYTTAAAAHVVVSQLKYIFGVNTKRFNGPLALIYTVIDICSQLPKTNTAILLISIFSIVPLIVVKEFNATYRKKLFVPIPIELIVVVAATLASYYGDMEKRYDVDVVGHIPSGINPPTVPDISIFLEVIGDAFAIAIVSYAIAVSLAKTFALKYSYKVDTSQELVAMGFSNVTGGFFHCYSITCSLSRSMVQETTGGHTQVAGLIAGLIVFITILKLGPLFKQLPKSVLSTIVFVNLKGMFKQCEDIPILWKKSKTDLVVWLFTLVSTILLNLDMGLAASIAFALLIVIFRTQKPRYSVLGQLPGTDIYLDMEKYKQAREIPGIIIFRSSATMYFANAELYTEALEKKSGIDIGKLLALKRKQIAKQQRKQKREEQRAKKESKKLGAILSTRPMSYGTMFSLERVRNLWKKESRPEPGDPQGHNTHEHMDGVAMEAGPDCGHVNLGYQNGETGELTIAWSTDGSGKQPNHASTGVSLSDVHSIILDLSTVSFTDIVTVNTLRNIFSNYEEAGLDVYMVGCQPCVVEQMESSDFFSASLTKGRLFATIHDAVLHCLWTRSQASAPHSPVALDMPCNTKL